MNTAETALTPTPPKTLENLLVGGDLTALTIEERLDYYARVCDSLGLNPLTKPFAYIKLNGKLVLYALRDCTEQLRKLHKVSVTDMRKDLIGDVYVIEVALQDGTGRTDRATGAVPIKGLTGENLANAYMKCETKAKRRGTLSICGLGMLDETEVASIEDVGEPYAPPQRASATTGSLRHGDEVRTLPADTAVGGGADAPTTTADPVSAAAPAPAPAPPVPLAAVITRKQHNALEAALREYSEGFGRPLEEVRANVKNHIGKEFGKEHFPDLTPHEYQQVMHLLLTNLPKPQPKPHARYVRGRWVPAVRGLALLAVLITAGVAGAQVPADPYHYRQNYQQFEQQQEEAFRTRENWQRQWEQQREQERALAPTHRGGSVQSFGDDDGDDDE
jgi:hypothetical protein